MLWSNQRMSLLFLISGSAVAFILPKMSAWQFFRSRHKRILLPLLFGMLVVVVPQVYIEAQSIGLIDADYGFLRFCGDYLNQHSPLFGEHKTIGRWHLTWNHLWYLAYILVYSQILCGLHHLVRYLSLQHKALQRSTNDFLATVYTDLLADAQRLPVLRAFPTDPCLLRRFF